MIPSEQLSLWREEIAQALEQLQFEVPAVKEQLAAAERARAAARAASNALAEAANKGLGPMSAGMARALYTRLSEQTTELARDPACEIGGLRSKLRALDEDIADHRAALGQIDRALEPQQSKKRIVVRREGSVDVVYPFDVVASSG